MKQTITHITFSFLLPLLLLVYGIFNLFVYLKSGEFGITNLDVRGSFSDLISTGSGELLKGDIATGKFHSNYPNLGLISVRFYNQDRDSDDVLVFRLKESGQEKWFYQAEYKTDQFLPHKHFPFGFPVIKDSADKDYVFEIESTRGATGGGVYIDYQKPVFIAKSSFPKNLLINDKKQLGYFLINKFTNIFGDKDTLQNTFYYFLPIIFYVLYIFTRGFSFHILLSVLIAFSYFDIFKLVDSFDALYMAIIFLYGLTAYRHLLESRVAAVFALTYLSITPILLIFNLENYAEKTAVWAYLFLCITVFQQIYELKKKPKKLYSLKSFVNNLLRPSISEDSFYYRHPTISNFLLSIIGIILTFLSGNKIYKTFLTFYNYYPNNQSLIFIKNTFIYFLITAVVVYSFTKFIKLPKNIFVRFVLIALVSYIPIYVFMNRSMSFYGKPIIYSISPQETEEAWTDVTITGKNFRDLPFVGSVTIDGFKEKVSIIKWTDTKITFRTNPQLTKSGNIKVIPLDRPASNQKPFVYTYK